MVPENYDWATGWAPIPIPSPTPSSQSLRDDLNILRVKLENLDTLLHRIFDERDSHPAAKRWLDTDWLLMSLDEKPSAYLDKVGDVYRDHMDWVWEVEAQMSAGLEVESAGAGKAKSAWEYTSRAREAEREVDAYADVLRDVLAGVKHASVEAALEKLRVEINGLVRHQHDDVEQRSAPNARRLSSLNKENEGPQQQHAPRPPLPKLGRDKPAAVLSSVADEKLNAKIDRDIILSRLMGIGRKVQPTRSQHIQHSQQTFMADQASPASPTSPVSPASSPSKRVAVTVGEASIRVTRSAASSVTRRSSLRHVKTLSVEEVVVAPVTPASPGAVAVAGGPIRRSSRHRRKSSRFEPYA